MQSLSQIVQSFVQTIGLSLAGQKLRQAVIVALMGVIVLTTTACTSSSTTSLAVPDTTEANIERAQGNLSDQGVDENKLSRQSPSLAERSDGTTAAP